MPSSFSIAPADPAERWSIIDGTPPSYELVVTSAADKAVLCTLSLDEPAGAGSVEPRSFTLLPGETRAARVSFNPHAITAQTTHAVVSVRAADGTTLASLDHELRSGGETDCNIALAWQRPIVENDAVTGFVLSCSVKNVGPTRARFELQFTKHPALRFDQIDAVTLDPAATTDVPVAVRWNETERDMIGKNHPDAIEVFAETSKGRRASRLPWQIIDQQYAQASGKPNGAAAPVAAATARAQIASAPAVQAAAAATAQSPPTPTLGDESGKPYTRSTTILPPPKTMQSLLATPQAPPPKEPWMQRLPEPAPTASPLASAVTIVSDEERRATAARPHPKRDPAVRYSTLILSAFGVIALVVAIVLFFRPGPPAPAITSITQITPMPAAQVSLPPVQPVAAHKKKPRAKAKTAPTSAVAAVAANPQPAVATAQAPATPLPVTAAPARVATGSNAFPTPGSLNEPVSLYNVDASFEGSRGVRVNWESSGQASAQIQLTNSQGRLVGRRSIRGDAQTSLILLPRGFHGPIFVQVVAVGHQGDRVTESTQLGGL